MRKWISTTAVKCAVWGVIRFQLRYWPDWLCR